VTVYLRAISTSTGKILKTVYTSKTILSQQVDASLFRFVNFKRLLETETGFTYNEPSEMAVKDAIEKSVQALIYEGFGDNLWSPRDTADAHGPGIRSYQKEKAENLTIDVLGRQVQPRRTGFGLGLAGAAQQYRGDYTGPVWRPGAELTLRAQVSAPVSLFLNLGRGQLAAGPGGSFFSQTFTYAEAGVLYRLLPSDRLTPYLLLGAGATGREPLRWSAPAAVLPHVVAGVGAEFLVAPRLGLSLGVDNHYYLSDRLDLVGQGRYNDYYWAGRAGLTFYLGQLKVKQSE
jgi:curli production assembly/transport component CsgG